jgi:sarcosine oxidase
LTLARRHGADIRTGEAVTAVEPRAGGQGVRVRSSATVHEAATVVVSIGAWVRGFVPAGMGQRFAVTRQVLSWFEPAGNADDYLADRMPNFIRLPAAGGPVVYGFPRVSASVTDMKVAAETGDSACDPDRVNRTITSDELSQLYAVASRAVRLKPGATRAATCLYTETPGSRFVIDRHPDSEDVIVVSPCSGHGFKHSAAIGECVAAMALGERPAIDLSAFGFDRLGRVV